MEIPRRTPLRRRLPPSSSQSPRPVTPFINNDEPRRSLVRRVTTPDENIPISVHTQPSPIQFNSNPGMVTFPYHYEGDDNVFGQSTPTPTLTDTVTGTKRYFPNGSENDDEPDGDGSPPKKRPALNTLPLLRKRIVELGKDAVRVAIATQEPFAAGPKMDRILTASWLYGHKQVKADFDLMAAEMNVNVPTEGELTVVSSRDHCMRGTRLIILNLSSKAHSHSIAEWSRPSHRSMSPSCMGSRKAPERTHLLRSSTGTGRSMRC